MTTPLLRIENLTLGYGPRTVLADLNLTVERARWVALVGPNASGKSTLLRCIAGRHAPLRGHVSLAGQAAHPTHGIPAVQPGFATPPDELPPFLTLRQSLDIYASAHGLAAPPPDCIALTTLLGLDAHAHTLVKHCSLGTRQKLAIVLALMLRPSLLLLDEVFNGLDFSSALKLREHLRERVDRDGMTVLLATHALDVVLRCCDELVLLEGGRLALRLEISDFSGPDGLVALERTLADTR